MQNKFPNSNKDVNWASHYDFYEIELREMYRTQAKQQNESHFEMVKEHLKNYLDKTKVFAEIGFGTGLTLRYFSPFFNEVYGLDISPQNVEHTKIELSNEGFKNIHLYTLDILTKDERFKGKFDVISFIHGLEHFSEKDYPILFENINYYLSSNGVFTGALPNDLKFNFRMCPNCNHTFEIDGHLSRHTINSLKKLFNENKMEIIHLDNFNYSYYLKSRGLVKFIVRKFMHKILHKPPKGQLEFIVKPIR